MNCDLITRLVRRANHLIRRLGTESSRFFKIYDYYLELLHQINAFIVHDTKKLVPYTIDYEALKANKFLQRMKYYYTEPLLLEHKLFTLEKDYFLKKYWPMVKFNVAHEGIMFRALLESKLTN